MGDFSAICVVDWNNDGLIDILVGDSYGKLWLLINSGTKTNPLFEAAVRVQNGAGDLVLSGESSPSVGDWNRDGKKDLICGEADGTLVYFENRGSDASPLLNGSEKLKTGYYPGNYSIDLGDHSRPYIMDWDGDGVLDILAGHNMGYLWIYRAMGPLFLSNNALPENASGTTPRKTMLNRGESQSVSIRPIIAPCISSELCG